MITHSPSPSPPPRPAAAATTTAVPTRRRELPEPPSAASPTTPDDEGRGDESPFGDVVKEKKKAEEKEGNPSLTQCKLNVNKI